MASSSFEELLNIKSRIVQDKGRVVLPKEWRDEQDVTKGDAVVFRETDAGRLEVIPPSEGEEN